MEDAIDSPMGPGPRAVLMDTDDVDQANSMYVDVVAVPVAGRCALASASAPPSRPGTNDEDCLQALCRALCR